MRVEAFLRDLDRSLGTAFQQPCRLTIIGSTALMLQADYTRGTKDSDVLETAGLDTAAREALLRLGGRGSALHARHQLYLDLVRRGLLFLPQAPRIHPLPALNRDLGILVLDALDVADVVVSKLVRFHTDDLSDIQAMVVRGLVDHADLLDRFRAAVDAFSMDARAEDLPKTLAHLHRVERDCFGAGPTDIELPGWIG